MDVLYECVCCRKDKQVSVKFDEYINYLGGELIQDAMPSLSAIDREALISRICPDCQKKIFREF